MSITKCIIGNQARNFKKKYFLTSITKLKIIQLIDNDNTMHSQTAQNPKIEFAELVSYLITHTP